MSIQVGDGLDASYAARQAESDDALYLIGEVPEHPPQVDNGSPVSRYTLPSAHEDRSVFPLLADQSVHRYQQFPPRPVWHSWPESAIAESYVRQGQLAVFTFRHISAIIILRSIKISPVKWIFDFESAAGGSAMERVVEAIYENGVLTPLESLDLPEHQQLTITIRLPDAEDPDQALESWQKVYSGLSEHEIAEIESIALDRNHFMRQES